MLKLNFFQKTFQVPQKQQTKTLRDSSWRFFLLFKMASEMAVKVLKPLYLGL